MLHLSEDTAAAGHNLRGAEPATPTDQIGEVGVVNVCLLVCFIGSLGDARQNCLNYCFCLKGSSGHA